MAYTRKTSGTQLVVNIQQMSDGTFNWNVKENFTGAAVDSKTGDQKGLIILDEGSGVADYDTAAAAAKSAFTAAG